MKRKTHPLVTILKQGRHHPGYVVGVHWLTAAYARICAGEDELRVMSDYGYVPEAATRAARRAK